MRCFRVQFALLSDLYLFFATRRFGSVHAGEPGSWRFGPLVDGGAAQAQRGGRRQTRPRLRGHVINCARPSLGRFLLVNAMPAQLQPHRSIVLSTNRRQLIVSPDFEAVSWRRFWRLHSEFARFSSDARLITGIDSKSKTKHVPTLPRCCRSRITETTQTHNSRKKCEKCTKYSTMDRRSN